MNYFGLILISILSLSFGQDRSAIFNASPPQGYCEGEGSCVGDVGCEQLVTTIQCHQDMQCNWEECEELLTSAQCGQATQCNWVEEGYLLNNDGDEGVVVADRFFVANDYALEAFKVWLKLIYSPSGTGSVNVKLHYDFNASPGEIIYSWDIAIDPDFTGLHEYLMVTLGECHTMLGGNDYWISITVNEPEVQILWGNSASQSYFTSTSNDLGTTWESPVQGYAGALTIWAEQIYNLDEIDNPVGSGDINQDGIVNILDIVQVVNYILGNPDFSEEQIALADYNQDNNVDILDIVQIVNHILSDETQYIPKFMAEDINPNSDYFGDMIGPDTFSGDISCYYFGKAG